MWPVIRANSSISYSPAAIFGIERHIILYMYLVSLYSVLLFTTYNKTQERPEVTHILYFRDGTITEQGNYQTLMAAGGQFAKIMACVS